MVSLDWILPMLSCQHCNHPHCPTAWVRGMRNGFYYGARVRISHALVMGFLFGKGSTIDVVKNAVKMAWFHGRNLGVFVFVYKLF